MQGNVARSLSIRCRLFGPLRCCRVFPGLLGHVAGSTAHFKARQQEECTAIIPSTTVAAVLCSGVSSLDSAYVDLTSIGTCPRLQVYDIDSWRPILYFDVDGQPIEIYAVLKKNLPHGYFNERTGHDLADTDGYPIVHWSASSDRHRQCRSRLV